MEFRDLSAEGGTSSVSLRSAFVTGFVHIEPRPNPVSAEYAAYDAQRASFFGSDRGLSSTVRELEPR